MASRLKAAVLVRKADREQDANPYITEAIDILGHLPDCKSGDWYYYVVLSDCYLYLNKFVEAEEAARASLAISQTGRSPYEFVLRRIWPR